MLTIKTRRGQYDKKWVAEARDDDACIFYSASVGIAYAVPFQSPCHGIMELDIMHPVMRRRWTGRGTEANVRAALKSLIADVAAARAATTC